MKIIFATSAKNYFHNLQPDELNLECLRVEIILLILTLGKRTVSVYIILLM